MKGGGAGGVVMLCVMGEECQYLAVKYRVEEIMFLPHEAFHYFKLPLQSRLKDPSSSSPDKSSSNGMNDLTGATTGIRLIRLVNMDYILVVIEMTPYCSFSSQCENL